MHPISRDDLHLAVEFDAGSGSWGAEAYIDLCIGAIRYGDIEMVTTVNTGCSS